MDDLIEEAARGVLHDKVHAEARRRHMSDATQSGFEHHLVVVAGEHAARAAVAVALERAAKAFEAEADTWVRVPQRGSVKREGARVIRSLAGGEG